MKHVKFPKLDKKELKKITGGANKVPASCTCNFGATNSCIDGSGSSSSTL